MQKKSTMKTFCVTLLMTLFCHFSYAQKKCDYSIQTESDSLGTYRATKEQLMYERIFGKSESYIFFTLHNDNGIPYLTTLFVNKDSEFLPIVCFDENSRIFIELENGNIVTLLHTKNESCGTTVRDTEDDKNTRIINGTFYFMKGSFELLQQHPIVNMRVRFGTEQKDYRIKTELDSENLNLFCRPASYFIDYLHCID